MFMGYTSHICSIYTPWIGFNQKKIKDSDNFVNIVKLKNKYIRARKSDVMTYDNNDVGFVNCNDNIIKYLINNLDQPNATPLTILLW